MMFMTEKMDTVMDDRAKRDHDDLSLAASGTEQHGIKKVGNKPTPTKKNRSSSFEETDISQLP
jgi:hypothetical protein